MTRSASDFTSGTLQINGREVRFGSRTVQLDAIRSFRVTRGHLAWPTAGALASVLAAWLAAGWLATALFAATLFGLWVQLTSQVLRVRTGLREYAVLSSPDAVQVRDAARALGEALQQWRSAGIPPRLRGIRIDAVEARMRRAAAEALVLRTGDKRAIGVLAKACRQPDRYAETLGEGARQGMPVLHQALETLAGLTGRGGSGVQILRAAQCVIDIDLGDDLSTLPGILDQAS